MSVHIEGKYFDEKMKEKNGYIKKRLNKQKWLDICSLCSVMHYLIYRFLQSTMFDLVYTNIYKYFVFFSLLVFGGGRLLFICCSNDLQNRGKENRITCIIVLIFSSVFSYIGWIHDTKIWIFYPIIILCLYKMDARMVFKWYVWTIGIMLFATILCSLTGVVRNLIIVDDNGDLLAAYGIINTSDLASYITFLVLFLWCSQKKEGISQSVAVLAICIILNSCTYIVTKSRTAMICGILSGLAIIVDYIIADSKRRSKKGRHKIQSLIGYISVISFCLICLFYFIISILFIQQNPFAIWLDRILSGRIQILANAYEQYGIHLIGTRISSMHGHGGTMISYGWLTSGYKYLDSAYSMLIIRDGLLIFFLILCIWMFLAKKTGKNNIKIAMTMVIISIHAFSEARFIDLNYNILLAMPLCNFPIKQQELEGKNEIRIFNQKRTIITYLYKWGLVLLTFGIIISFLPNGLSWLRTVFTLNKWKGGNDSILALIICIGIILLLCFVISFVFKNNRKKVAILFTIMICAVSGVCVGNILINKGMMDKRERLESEESIVRTVQSVAKQPVYVSSLPELYQKQFGGFSNRLYSTDELYREPQGTIITEIDEEALGIYLTHGIYAQISPWSGIYTFDVSVIEKLNELGYEWASFYYAERSCDLNDLALRNGLSLNNDNHIILDGPFHSINNNVEIDQYSGYYEVRYTMKLIKNKIQETNHPICSLIVTGEAGDREIVREDLFQDSFHGETECVITLPYVIGGTPRVSYLMTVSEGVEIELEEIAWRRTS